MSIAPAGWRSSRSPAPPARFKIAQLVSIAIPQLIGGGAEKVTTRFASDLHRQGFLSRLYTGDRAGEEEVAGLPLVNLDAPRALQAASRFARAMLSDPADAVLLTLGYVNLAPCARLRRPRPRIVLRIGNTMTPEMEMLPSLARLRYAASMRVATRSADAIIVQCRAMGEDLVRHMPEVEGKLRVVYNPVEDELWEWTAPEDRPLSEPYIFCAASMKPQKGLDILLAAYARSSVRKTTRLVIAGVAADDARFSRSMIDNGLAVEEVLRIGFVRTPYQWIAHSELCVLPSRYEGFSNFLLEAAALGKRTVATDCPGGNGELFAHYRNSVIVPVGDVEALAQAIATERYDLPRAEARESLRPFQQSRIYRQYSDILAGTDSAAGPAEADA